MSTEGEAPAVTFVGGIAVEQNLAADSNLEEGERESAKRAVREAIAKQAGEDAAEESKKVVEKAKPPGTTKTKDEPAPERGPDGKFLPKDAPKDEAKEPEEESFDPETANVKQLFKNREKIAAMKKDAKDEISKERQAVAAEKAEMARHWQAMEQAKAELKRQHESMQSLRKDPARAIRELGYDPEQFILDLAQEGTAEGAARRKQQEIDNQLAEIKSWRQQQADQAKQQQEHAQQEHHRQYRQHAVNTFISTAFNEDKYPHVSNFYKGDERSLVAIGDATAAEYRQLSGGKEGSYEDILDYLEDNLANRTKAWYSKGSNKKESVTESVGKPPKAVSKGKSLSPDSSGERRSLQPKDLRDLNADERIETAKQAVAVALAASRNSD